MCTLLVPLANEKYDENVLSLCPIVKTSRRPQNQKYTQRMALFLEEDRETATIISCRPTKHFVTFGRVVLPRDALFSYARYCHCNPVCLSVTFVSPD